MDNIRYLQATESDIQLLVDYRIDFLTGYHGKQEARKETDLRMQLQDYFKESLRNHTYLCWYALAGDEVAGIGGMVIRQRPGSFINPSGREGYLMSIYTPPTFRRKGIASAITNKLVETAITMGITTFELHATVEGEEVYKKCGFNIHGQNTFRKYV